VLEALGLDPQTEAVYRTMLARPEWGVDDLVDHLGLTEPEVRACLDRLADLSLARPAAADPGRWRPVSPEIGLEALLARQRMELAGLQQQVERSHAAAAGLLATYAALRLPVAGPDLERLGDPEEIRARVTSVVGKARHDVVALLPGRRQEVAGLMLRSSLAEGLRARGVRVAAVHPYRTRTDAVVAGHVRRMTALGCEIRVAPTLPVCLLITDGDSALLPSVPGDRCGTGGILVHHPAVVGALQVLFEEVWRTAQPFGEPPHRDGNGLTGIERELLELLARGLTDEAAGRKLGVSLRTVRRMMADLTTRLGATSRFQAGLRAHELGWLTDPDPM